MLDRLVDIFCQVDDFCKAFDPWFRSQQLEAGARAPRGPKSKLADSEIITLLLILHNSGSKYLKSFYNNFALELLKPYFPGMPCYEHFVELQKRVLVPLTYFLMLNMGEKTGIYYIDSTPLAVCHNLRISRHKTFKGLASRGKSSTGWFFGFKLHLVFNDLHEIVNFKLTPGNVHDTQPVETLTKNLFGKIFGDKGYMSQKLSTSLLSRGLTLFTRVRKNMKSLPISMTDKLLLNARNMAETIIGHIKACSSLNIPKHRSPINALIHIIVAITSYQLDPIKPKINQKGQQLIELVE